MGLLQNGSAVGAIAALACVAVGLATPGWVYVFAGETYICVIGLFYTDLPPESADKAHIYLATTATMVCICCLSSGASFLIVSAIASIHTGNFMRGKALAKVGGISAIIAGLIIGAGMGAFTGLTMTSQIYTDYVADSVIPSYTWGYSFYVAWSSVGVSLISGIIGLLGKSRPSHVSSLSL